MTGPLNEYLLASQSFIKDSPMLPDLFVQRFEKHAHVAVRRSIGGSHTRGDSLHVGLSLRQPKARTEPAQDIH